MKQKETMEAKKRIEEEMKDLYKIPEHLDVDRMNKDRRFIDNTSWVHGLMEVPVSQDKLIKNVEEAERLRMQSLKKGFQSETSNK